MGKKRIRLESPHRCKEGDRVTWQSLILTGLRPQRRCISAALYAALPLHCLDIYDQSGKERVDADGITRALQVGRVMEEKTELLAGSYK